MRVIQVASLLLLLAVPATAGVVYEIEVTDHEQSPPKTESTQGLVDEGSIRMGIASGGRGKQGEMIFRGDRREMVVVDHENRTYHQFDAKAMGAIAGQLSEAERMMQEALKNVPEDKRAMIEQMMKQKMPPGTQAPPARIRTELRKTSERGTKVGYPCVRYDVFRGDVKIRELWVTDWSNVEGGSDMVGVFEDMADFFGELMDSLPSSFGGGNDFGDPAFEHMREIGGFPVVTREFDDYDGSLEGETFLRSSRRETIVPDAFEPPSGYKYQSMFNPN